MRIGEDGGRGEVSGQRGRVSIEKVKRDRKRGRKRKDRRKRRNR